MNTMSSRSLRAGGSPYEIGKALGARCGSLLGQTIDTYIQQGPSRFGSVDVSRLRPGALPWLRHLPQRFQDEIEGLADGSGLPLQRLAEWSYVEACTTYGCSSVLSSFDQGHPWVGRNNDLWAPSVWGYSTVRDHQRRLSTLSFGMPAEPFTCTGVNERKLWLHYHYLPPRDRDPAPPDAWFEFVWMTEALETCSDLEDVESLLGDRPRRGCMLLFAVDGKSDRRAVYQCEPTSFLRWPDSGASLPGTNHRYGEQHPSPGSAHRLQRIHQLLGLPTADPPLHRLRTLLADPEVEQNEDGSGTVFSAIACPATGEIWFTFGGYPAASHGRWEPVPWPWVA